MAAEILLLTALVMLSVRVGQSAESMITLTCQSAVGILDQSTNIFCDIKSEADTVIIKQVILQRIGEEKPCVSFDQIRNEIKGDSRFKLVNRTSLQLRSTKLSDEIRYTYFVRTSQGNQQAEFGINVIAKYSSPIITSVPEEIESGEHADLFCKASSGYPAGTIHWFDQSNTNWTKNAILTSTVGPDGLFTLSSKLSFQRIDSLWAPFRCVVLNSRYEDEGGSTLTLERKEGNEKKSTVDQSTLKNSIAGVIVISSLIVGLLIALFFKRRRDEQIRRASLLPILSTRPPEQVCSEEDEELYGHEDDMKIKV